MVSSLVHFLDYRYGQRGAQVLLALPFELHLEPTLRARDMTARGARVPPRGRFLLGPEIDPHFLNQY
jgi:hypothetical protein